MKGMKDEGIAGSAPLKPLQVRFVDAYVALGDVPGAASLVGIDRTTGWRWLQLPEVRGELTARMHERTRRVQAALFEREKAAFAVIDVLLSSPDDKVKMRVAIWIVDTALKVRAETVPPRSLFDLQLEAWERQVAAGFAEMQADPKEAL